MKEAPNSLAIGEDLDSILELANVITSLRNCSIFLLELMKGGMRYKIISKNNRTVTKVVRFPYFGFFNNMMS